MTMEYLGNREQNHLERSESFVIVSASIFEELSKALEMSPQPQGTEGWRVERGEGCNFLREEPAGLSAFFFLTITSPPPSR
jgi:hypothetical protein